MPLSGSPQLVKETDEADTDLGTDNTEVAVYYGARANMDSPAGTYTGTVLYTILTDANTTDSATITPSTTTTFAGGDSVRFVTSLLTNGDVGDVSVLIGEDECTVTGTDMDDDTFAVTCTLPEKPALAVSYDVTVSVPKYDKTYTITDGLTYQYINTLTSISTMQAMTTAICSATTTPEAFDADGNINANVPQASLRDTRDNNYYTVRKLADGNCWMVNNLKLTGPRTLTSSDTDTSASRTLQTTVTTGTSVEFTLRFTKSYVFNLNISSVSEPRNDGYLYNFHAAIMEADDTSVASANKTYTTSICPKNWTLPIGWSTGANTFYDLIVTTYGITSATQLTSPPFDFTYTGTVSTTVTSMNPDRGSYWTRTIKPVSGQTYSRAGYMIFSSLDDGVNANYHHNPNNGFAVRCLAR